MDTLILNEEFSMILYNKFPSTLKGLHVVPLTKDCRANLCNFEDYSTDLVSTDALMCKLCNEESSSLSESGSSDGSVTSSEKNNSIFPPVYKKAQYPLFYNEWMCSEKEHPEFIAHFMREEWLTNELIEELMYFTPALYEATANVNMSDIDHQL